MKPSGYGWQLCGEGWACEVWQSAFGHRASKATWLYCVSATPPPEPLWSRPVGTHQVGFHDQRGADRNKPTLGKREANATPLEMSKPSKKTAAATEGCARPPGYVALPRARQEGRWAWRAGQPLTAQPYCEEVNGAEAVLWQIGWLELAQLHCALDAVMFVQSDNCNNMVGRGPGWAVGAECRAVVGLASVQPRARFDPPNGEAKPRLRVSDGTVAAGLECHAPAA